VQPGAIDITRLLLLEAAVSHLVQAGVIDEERVLDQVIDGLRHDLDADIPHAETRAGHRAQVRQQIRHAREQSARAVQMRGDHAALATGNAERIARSRAALDRAYDCLAALKRVDLGR
jgi:FKBP-type peptidyl-prolyl cis-trans isomerase (trigger factor)